MIGSARNFLPGVAKRKQEKLLRITEMSIPRAPVVLAALFVGANALTLFSHFSSGPVQTERAVVFLDFAGYDMARFDAAMAQGHAVLVHVGAPTPALAERLAGLSGITFLQLSPAACPGVAAALDAAEPGLLVAYRGGGERARVSPGTALDAALSAVEAALHPPL